MGRRKLLDTAKGKFSPHQRWVDETAGVSEKQRLPCFNDRDPTTGGTGSECQSYALISNDSNHRKMACGDPSALPKITLLDPELTCSQPFSVCAATGMDALAHT